MFLTRRLGHVPGVAAFNTVRITLQGLVSDKKCCTAYCCPPEKRSVVQKSGCHTSNHARTSPAGTAEPPRRQPTSCGGQGLGV